MLMKQLARPKLRAVDKDMVFRLVEENAKKRFELFYGRDPSPPVVKVKAKGKGQVGKGKGKAHDQSKGGRPEAGGSGGTGGGRGSRRTRANAQAQAGQGKEVAVAEAAQAVDAQGADIAAADFNGSQATVKGTASATDFAAVEQLGSELSRTAVSDAQSPNTTTSNPSIPDASVSTITPPPTSTAEPAPAPVPAPPPPSTELPLIPLTPPTTDTSVDPAAPASDTAATGEWFIRASQGHSIALAGVAHLTPVLDDEDGRRRAGLLVHGTRWELWETLSEWDLRRSAETRLVRRAGLRDGEGARPVQPPLLISAHPPATALQMPHYSRAESTGLSRMARQHIHLAPALSLSPSPHSTTTTTFEFDPTSTSDSTSVTPNLITPRPYSTLLIYLDLAALLRAGIPVYTSANGVVLTPGDADGRVTMDLWARAERVVGGLSGARTVVWEAGRDVRGAGAQARVGGGDGCDDAAKAGGGAE
jgi:2'-phosphotransferase